MRQHLSAKVMLLVIAAILTTPLRGATGEQDPQVVTIRITDANNCVVEDTRVLCDNVVAYLRDVLKVPVRTQFRIVPGKASPYEATAKLMEQFQKSEYKLKMGYVNVDEDPKD